MVGFSIISDGFKIPVGGFEPKRFKSRMVIFVLVSVRGSAIALSEEGKYGYSLTQAGKSGGRKKREMVI